MLEMLLQQLRIAAAKEDGATMTEYGIMIALIAAVSIGVVALIGTDILNAFNTVEGQL